MKFGVVDFYIPLSKRREFQENRRSDSYGLRHSVNKRLPILSTFLDRFGENFGTGGFHMIELSVSGTRDSRYRARFTLLNDVNEVSIPTLST